MLSAPLLRMRVLAGELGEKLPNMERTDLVVPDKTPIEKVVLSIYNRMLGRRVERLTLICHGVGALVYGDMYRDEAKGMWRRVALPGAPKLSSSRIPAVCRIYGGYGLYLGEDISLENASTFRQLRGRFSEDGVMEIFGCA